MCDFEDDFGDDFNEGDFGDNLEEDMDEDSFLEMDDPCTDDAELDDKPDQAEPQDDDLTVDPFLIGGAMGWAYEEGLRERKRRKRKNSEDDDDSSVD
jgi:hypothetical protein